VLLQVRSSGYVLRRWSWHKSANHGWSHVDHVDQHKSLPAPFNQSWGSCPMTSSPIGSAATPFVDFSMRMLPRLPPTLARSSTAAPVSRLTHKCVLLAKYSEASEPNPGTPRDRIDTPPVGIGHDLAVGRKSPQRVATTSYHGASAAEQRQCLSVMPTHRCLPLCDQTSSSPSSGHQAVRSGLCHQ